jgi:short-subunit dehydrogenase
MAERFAAEGMHLVLVDVDEPALERTAADLGGEAHVVDVTDTEALEALARNVPVVHVLCPNAGVAPVGPVLEMSKQTWDWLLGVNLTQVVHLTRLYGPRMVEQGDGHIVYTASGAGLMAVPTLGPYCVTKHGVVALAETLFLELQGTGVGVSVLCPGLVKTGIFDSERNRPDRFGGSDHEADEIQQFHQAMLTGTGIEPSVVADLVVDAIRAEQLWILPHPELKPMVTARAESIVGGANPSGMSFG